MRIAFSLVSLALYLGFTAAAVIPNAGDISSRDNGVSEGSLSRRLPDDIGKGLGGVVENIKRDPQGGCPPYPYPYPGPYPYPYPGPYPGPYPPYGGGGLVGGILGGVLSSEDKQGGSDA